MDYYFLSLTLIVSCSKDKTPAGPANNQGQTEDNGGSAFEDDKIVSFKETDTHDGEDSSYNMEVSYACE